MVEVEPYAVADTSHSKITGGKKKSIFIQLNRVRNNNHGI